MTRTLIVLTALLAGCGNAQLTQVGGTRTVSGALGEKSACPTPPAGRRGHVSVTDFGAIGDGVTDDTRAFQCAVAWLSPGGGGASNGGGTLSVPGGYYNIADTLELPAGLQLVGSNTTLAGFCQLRLTASDRPLLRITNGPEMTHIVVRDLELRFMGPHLDNWPIRPAFVRDSHTTGILMTGRKDLGWIQNLTFENLIIAGFTNGIAVDSGEIDRVHDPMVDAVRLSLVHLEGNTIGLRARSWNISNWNVETLTTGQHAGQVGVRVEGANLSLFQLNCQSWRPSFTSPATAGACLELVESTSMHVSNLHAEGPSHAVKVLASMSPHQAQLIFEGSFLGEGMLIEGQVHLLSHGNSFPGTDIAGTEPGVRKTEFVGDGSQSTVISLGDEFINPLNGVRGGHFLGLSQRAQRIDDSIFETRQLSVQGSGLPGPLIDLIAPARPDQALLRLGQENFHYTFRRNGTNGYLDLQGNQVASTDPAATWPSNVEWTGLSVNGALQLKRYAAPPNACSASLDGALTLTARYTTCVCNPTAGWVSTSDGTSACVWR